jgi:dTDP-glucose 4,6-dehydratase
VLKGKTIFITGGAGFIATGIVRRLIEDNRIILWDNFSRNSLGYFGLEGHPHLTVLRGDILDFSGLKAAVSPKTDIVIHTAAIAGIATVTKNPVRTWEVNALGTVNLLKALQELDLLERLERFVVFSTSEVYGGAALRVEENMPMQVQPVGEMRWVYAVSKLASEYVTYCYHKNFALRAVILRPFNVFGVGQVGEGAIQRFILQAINNEPITIYGDGSQIRSWCYIDDMVEGVLLALAKEEAVGEVFNIGNPQNTVTIFSLAEKIVQLAQSQSPIVFVPKEDRADVELRIPKIDKARRLLGFQPKVGLADGIQRTIEWFRNIQQRKNSLT